MSGEEDPPMEDRSAYSQWQFWWSKSEQEQLVFFFFLGYFLAQLPAGYLAYAVGGRRVLLGGTLSLALCQALAACAPRYGGYWAFAAAMGLAGLANGFIYAPFMDVLAKWIPPQESSVLTSLAASGIGFGIAVVYGLSAVTSRVTLLGGWPFNFISLGVMLLVLAVLIGVFVTDSPATSRFLGQRERDYIQSGSPEAVATATDFSSRCSSVPWRQILTSLPVYAVASSQLGTDWIQYFFITLFPLYLQRVRHMSAHTADLVTGLPWLAFPLCSYFISKLVDRLRRKGLISTTAIRKIVDGIGKLVPMGLLVVIVYLPTTTITRHLTPAPIPDNPHNNHTLYSDLQDIGDYGGETEQELELEPTEWVVVSMYVVSVLLLSCEGSSWLSNVVDLSPQWAGVVSSLCQVPSLLGSFLLPLVVQSVTPQNTEKEWRSCMLVMLGIVTSSYLFYVIFGSSELQNWASVTSVRTPTGTSFDDDRNDKNCNIEEEARLYRRVIAENDRIV